MKQPHVRYMRLQDVYAWIIATAGETNVMCTHGLFMDSPMHPFCTLLQTV